MRIKSVKVWMDPHRTEARIYVHTIDGREGCWYKTGNRWHEKGEKDGNLTAEDWAKARQIAVWDGQWHTVYQNEMNARYAQLPDDDDVLADLAAVQPRSETGGQNYGEMAVEQTGYA
jgi:hypothetical protein